MLEQVAERSELFKKESKLNRVLILILLYELLEGKLLKCSDKLTQPLLRNKTRLKGEYVKLGIKTGQYQKPEFRYRTPRYVRINTLKININDCLTELISKGFELIEDGELTDKKFKRDEHISDLLVFPPATNLCRSSLYLDGKIVLQDKASCLPVAILAPPTGAKVIDTCAAPGNKTTQLAAAVGVTGKVWAFERDVKRAQLLREMISRHVSVDEGLVTTVCLDFLSVDIKSNSYLDVEYCLVDPSCSGSGIIECIDSKGADKVDAKRLQSLANFQCMIIRHAMKLPNLKRLVYSTCSIHEEENERVVQEVLEAEPNFKLVSQPLPTWSRRGLGQYPFALDVIRVDPLLDGMTGFFVACFERNASCMS